MEKDIRNFIFNFYQPISMPGGWTFDHVNTLKFNHLYYYGKYDTGSFDAQGYYKFFANITKPTCDIATKFIDIDTGNIMLIPEGGSDENATYTWLMERKLRTWLKTAGFASTLNTISQEFPKGHVVLKRLKDKYKKVPIVSLRIDPALESLDKMPFIVEVHLMTEGEVREQGWNTDDLKRAAKKGNTYEIHECYIKDINDYKRVIYAGLYDIQGASQTRTPESKLSEGYTFIPSIKLHEDAVSRHPYREAKFEDVEGRWLGFGFPEYLKDNQISENEAENLERKALILKALQLYQTTDENIQGRNVLTDTMNGDILVSGDQIMPVAKDNADLSAYNNTRGRNMENIQRKTFTTDITTGANLPSRTPLGVASLQASLATSYFEQKQEDLGIFVKNLILDDVMPNFKRENRKEHAMTFLRSEEDRRKVEELVLDLKKWEIRAAYIEKTGFDATLEDIDRAWTKANEELKNKPAVEIKIPGGAYDEAKYRLDVVVTGESIDVSARSQVLQIALQIVGSNPAILQNDVTRSVFFKFLSLGGVNANEFNMVQSCQEQQQPMAQGGSVATPQPMQAGRAPTATAV